MITVHIGVMVPSARQRSLQPALISQPEKNLTQALNITCARAHSAQASVRVPVRFYLLGTA